MNDDLTVWIRQLRLILDAVADARRVLGIATAAVGLSGEVHKSAAVTAEEALPRIVTLVREANAIAERLHAADHRLGAFVLPLLVVPGEKAEVDLRPWWSRMLDRVSATARRNSAAESLETLRLEAGAALERAALAARG